MNIQQMKYVIEVEKTGSISQAAENLYMGQPNLSKAIKELELSLGIRIFKRTSSGVTATAGGTRLLADIKRILAQIEEVESRYKTGGAEKQNFSISVPHCGYITGVFASFVAELDTEKEIQIDFSETNSIRAISNITEEGYQLGIIRYHTSCEAYFLQLLSEYNLGYKEIWEFESLALMSAEHPLADQTSVKTADLNRFIEIFHGGCAIQKHPQGAECESLKPAGGPKRICVHERGSQLDLLCSNPHTYMWTAPMPEEVLSRMRLKQKSCADYRNICKDVLIFPHGYSLKGLESLFIQKLEQEVG